MTNIRNQEQINADEALSLAVENCVKAYMPEHANGYTLSDFLVLTSLQKLTTEGIVVTQYPLFMNGGDIPWYKVLGLIEMHTLMAKREITVGRDNG